MDDDAFSEQRARLVERIQNTTRIRDSRLYEAFAQVPRHRFVPESQVDYAYEDRALPLSELQTISQPTMIAIMLDALRCRPEDHALEVGAGSGYAAALLGRLVAQVDAIEIRSALAERAQRTLEEIGADNVRIHVGDGTRGLSERGPFQRILVSAGAGAVPPALLEQLAPGGRIAIPVGNEATQTLLVGERTNNGAVHWEQSVPCMFVPLIEPS
jgi:protein-L-isoaspartate(D-aspartate) O-methyltransferase